jgi:hypothetical protein
MQTRKKTIIAIVTGMIPAIFRMLCSNAQHAIIDLKILN